MEVKVGTEFETSLMRDLSKIDSATASPGKTALLHRTLQTVDHIVKMKSSVVDQGKVVDVSFKRSASWQLLLRRIFSCIK